MLPEIPSKNCAQHLFHSEMMVAQRVAYLIWSCILILLAMLPSWCPECAKLEQDLYHNANFSINYSFVLLKDYVDSSINWVGEHRHTGRCNRLQHQPARCSIWAVWRTTSLIHNFGWRKQTELWLLDVQCWEDFLIPHWNNYEQWETLYAAKFVEIVK